MKHPIMKLYNLINGCTALLVVALMTACSDKGGDSPDTGNTGTPDDDQTVAVGITTESSPAPMSPPSLHRVPR